MGKSNVVRWTAAQKQVGGIALAVEELIKRLPAGQAKWEANEALRRLQSTEHQIEMALGEHPSYEERIEKTRKGLTATESLSMGRVIGRTNVERWTAAQKQVETIRVSVEGLLPQLPAGQAKWEGHQALMMLKRTASELEGALKENPYEVARRKQAMIDAADNKKRRVEAGTRGVNETRAKGGRLVHGVEKEQDSRMMQIWFHGTTGKFDALAAVAPKSETRGFNARLGVHFASEYRSAETFAYGLYRHTAKERRDGQVYSVRLASEKVKTFATERAMNGEFFDFCMQRGDLRTEDIESLRSYRRIPKGDPDGGGWWEKVAISAGSDLAAGLKDLDKVVGAYRDHLVEQGYDAVVYLNDVEGYAEPCAIVFHDNQIEVVEVLKAGVMDDNLPKTYAVAAWDKKVEEMVLGI